MRPIKLLASALLVALLRVWTGKAHRYKREIIKPIGSYWRGWAKYIVIFQWRSDQLLFVCVVAVVLVFYKTKFFFPRLLGLRAARSCRKVVLCLHLTIRLWARDFYEVIVDEAEIESYQSNCFDRILTEINAFQLFFYALIIKLYL